MLLMRILRRCRLIEIRALDTVAWSLPLALSKINAPQGFSGVADLADGLSATPRIASS